MIKKCLLRNEKLEVNRASETEEKMKERLNKRRENKKKENHKKQRLATIKILKRGNYNELKRNLRLDLANTSGWQWRQKNKEEQDWRMMQLPHGSG